MLGLDFASPSPQINAALGELHRYSKPAYLVFYSSDKNQTLTDVKTDFSCYFILVICLKIPIISLASSQKVSRSKMQALCIKKKRKK